MSPERLTPETALQRLAEAKGPASLTLFRHGSLEVKVYRPLGKDPQTPHSRDEIYVVISGSGQFELGSLRRPVAPGEVLFAAAGEAHRFVDFTDDFATWVFFYGPQGGER